jgi:hypothetical protein
MTVGHLKGQVWSAGQVNLIGCLGEKKVFKIYVTCMQRAVGPKKWLRGNVYSTVKAELSWTKIIV